MHVALVQCVIPHLLFTFVCLLAGPSLTNNIDTVAFKCPKITQMICFGSIPHISVGFCVYLEGMSLLLTERDRLSKLFCANGFHASPTCTCMSHCQIFMGTENVVADTISTGVHLKMSL